MKSFLIGSLLLSILPPSCNAKSITPYSKDKLIYVIIFLIIAVTLIFLKYYIKNKKKNASDNKDATYEEDAPVNIDSGLNPKKTKSTTAILSMVFSFVGFFISAFAGILVLIFLLALEKAQTILLILGVVSGTFILTGFILAIISIILHKKKNPTNKKLPQEIKTCVSLSAFILAFILFFLLIYFI